jgi:hypothetical protein
VQSHLRCAGRKADPPPPTSILSCCRKNDRSGGSGDGILVWSAG